MEILMESWSLVVILLSAFVIGWAAETAQTFMSRALALSILAWLQTLPEFAVEAAIAWNQQRDLMIANLTGSLRLLVGLGWPMIFFVHFFFQGLRNRKFIREIVLEEEDHLSVLFLFISVMYFMLVLIKGSLTLVDSVMLTLIYGVYLIILMKTPPAGEEEHDDLPWIGQKIVKLPRGQQMLAVTALFIAGGAALLVSVEPFIHTLQKWAVAWGISTFVFIQWVSPFLSEFPEKVSAFNWARQKSKAPMALMNMVNSNINQWTMLAAMIPIVFCLSLGHIEAIEFDEMHSHELALTIAQSVLGGALLLDMRFSIFDAAAIFLLWLVQFMYADLRLPITYIYVAWIGYELAVILYRFATKRKVPAAFVYLGLSLARRRGRRANRP